MLTVLTSTKSAQIKSNDVVAYKKKAKVCHCPQHSIQYTINKLNAIHSKYISGIQNISKLCIYCILMYLSDKPCFLLSLS